MASALAVLFSLIMPKGVNIVLTCGLVFGGSTLITLAQNQSATDGSFSLLGWFVGYVPDFSKLNLVVRYTDGIPALDAGTFGGLLLYALIIMVFSISLGAGIFSRKAI